MRGLIKTIEICLAITLLAACQTSMLSEYNKLHTGMEKDQVLEIMGSPQRTERFHGKDRWTYVFYDKSTKYEKEVHFFEGNAIYVGDIWQPEVSAAQIDARNEAANKAEEEEVAKKYQNNSKEYIKYEESVHGNDKVRYVPDFKPIQ